MSKIDPRDFLVPFDADVTDLRKAIGKDTCFGEALGLRFQVTASSRDVLTLAGRFSDVEMTFTVRSSNRLKTLRLLKFDAEGWRIESNAAALAVADGAKDWAEVHEEDKARWRMLAAALPEPDSGRTGCPPPLVEAITSEAGDLR